ncbi:MAG TPA: hypothetical protein VGK73_07730 [Polyangiaceae bacterium]
MLTKTAETHFGGRAGIARALGPSRTVSAVYQWKDVVPLAAARKLAELSGGVVPVVDDLYDQYGRILRTSHSAA